MAENKEMRSIETDSRIQEYTSRLRALRADGVTKLADCKIALTAAKKNQLIDEAERKAQVDRLNAEIEKAKKVAEANKAEIEALSREAVAYTNSVAKEIEAEVTAVQNKRMAGAKAYYAKEVAEIRAAGQKREQEIQKLGIQDPKELKAELSIARYETKSALYDAKSRFQQQIDRAKAAKNQAYVDHIQKNRELRNGKAKFSEDMAMKWKNYKTNFSASKFFLANGLYIAIIIFFIVCIIIAPMRGAGNLLTLPNIFTILEQSSTRMFYALGVAGLILLAGTDLSIGRMVALGSVTTGLILHPGMNIVSFMGMGPWDFT